MTLHFDLINLIIVIFVALMLIALGFFLGQIKILTEQKKMDEHYEPLLRAEEEVLEALKTWDISAPGSTVEERDEIDAVLHSEAKEFFAFHDKFDEEDHYSE